LSALPQNPNIDANDASQIALNAGAPAWLEKRSKRNDNA
jgi:hypothetical protein